MTKSISSMARNSWNTVESIPRESGMKSSAMISPLRNCIKCEQATMRLTRRQKQLRDRASAEGVGSNMLSRNIELDRDEEGGNWFRGFPSTLPQMETICAQCDLIEKEIAKQLNGLIFKKFVSAIKIDSIESKILNSSEYHDVDKDNSPPLLSRSKYNLDGNYNPRKRKKVRKVIQHQNRQHHFYTDDERRRMVQYLIARNAIGQAKNQKIWQEFLIDQTLNEPQPSPRALLDQFRRKILKNYKKYTNDQTAMSQFEELRSQVVKSISSANPKAKTSAKRNDHRPGVGRKATNLRSATPENFNNEIKFHDTEDKSGSEDDDFDYEAAARKIEAQLRDFGPEADAPPSKKARTSSARTSHQQKGKQHPRKGQDPSILMYNPAKGPVLSPTPLVKNTRRETIIKATPKPAKIAQMSQENRKRSIISRNSTTKAKNVVTVKLSADRFTQQQNSIKTDKGIYISNKSEHDEFSTSAPVIPNVSTPEIGKNREKTQLNNINVLRDGKSEAEDPTKRVSHLGTSMSANVTIVDNKTSSAVKLHPPPTAKPIIEKKLTRIVIPAEFGIYTAPRWKNFRIPRMNKENSRESTPEFPHIKNNAPQVVKANSGESVDVSDTKTEATIADDPINQWIKKSSQNDNQSENGIICKVTADKTYKIISRDVDVTNAIFFNKTNQ